MRRITSQRRQHRINVNTSTRRDASHRRQHYFILTLCPRRWGAQPSQNCMKICVNFDSLSLRSCILFQDRRQIWGHVSSLANISEMFLKSGKLSYLFIYSKFHDTAYIYIHKMYICIHITYTYVFTCVLGLD